MSLQRVIINTGALSADGFKSVCNLSMLGLDAANNFLSYIGALCGGNQMAQLDFQVGAVQATATITSTGAAVAGETMTLANVTLTAVAADPGQNEFVPSATVGTQAANIAAAINASDDLAGLVTAVAVAGVVTVTSVVPGLVGNGLQIADVDLANVTVGVFENGADGTSYVLDLD